MAASRVIVNSSVSEWKPVECPSRIHARTNTSNDFNDRDSRKECPVSKCIDHIKLTHAVDTLVGR